MTRHRSGLLALVLVASAARAASAAPTPAQVAEAKEHYKKGSQLQAEGKYAASVAEYQVAYDLTQLPKLLFNLGQAYRLAGDKRHAVAAYRRYLEVAPDDQGAGDAQSFIIALSHDLELEDLAARQQAEAEAALAQKRAAEEAARHRQAEADARAALLRARPASPVPVAHPRPGGRTLRLAGLVTGGAGVVLTGVGILFAVRSRSLASQQQCTGSACESHRFDPGLVSDGNAANRNAYIFLGAGAAAVVTGGIVWYLGHRRDAEQVAVTPVVTGTAVGLVVGDRF